MTKSDSPGTVSTAQRLHLSTAKKVRYSALVFVLFFLSAEVAARVGSYLYFGRNPYYLLYGFRSWSNDEGEGHTDKHDGYFKFPPNQTLEFGTPEPSRINNRGFRGADFDAKKEDGTFRIVCMGASSTFGYLNRDDETYPVRLEALLNADPEVASGGPVEVINAGIPHFDTGHLAAALENELLGYEPDLLTVYTGCNDAVRPVAETGMQALGSTLDVYSAGYAALRKAINSVFGQVLFGQWTPYLATMDGAAIQRQLDLHTQETRANLERVVALAREANVPLVFIRQPITIWFDRLSRGLVDEDDPRPTYEDEYRTLYDRLVEEKALPGFEVTLYVHHHLLDVVDELAAENGLTTVDNVELVAEYPEGLGSKVHLTAEGNARLANALAETLGRIVKERRGQL